MSNFSNISPDDRERWRNLGIVAYGRTPLHVAAVEGDAVETAHLLAAGTDTEIQDKNGHTPLIAAAEFGRSIAVVKLLIEHGANILYRDREGFTPLHWAAWNGHSEIAELLIRNGAEVNDASALRFTHKGATPIGLANHKLQDDRYSQETRAKIEAVVKLLKAYGGHE